MSMQMSRRTRLTAVAAALAVGLTSCGFLDDLKDAIADLVAGGISFDSAGNLNAGGISVLQGGRTAESWTAKDQAANQAINDSTDQAIADFLLKRDQAALAGSLTGPTSEAGQLDSVVTGELPDYGSAEYFLPESTAGTKEVRKDGAPFVPGTQVRDTNYPVITGAQSGQDVDYTRYVLKPNGRQIVTLTTGVTAPVVTGEDPAVYRTGVTVTVNMVDGVAQDVSWTPVFRTVPTKLDLLKLKVADLAFERANYAPSPNPAKEGDGSWSATGFTVDLSLKDIAGITPFSSTFEIAFRVAKDGTIYLARTPYKSITPKPDSDFQRWLNEVFKNWADCPGPEACGLKSEWIDKNYPRTKELKGLAP